MFVPTVIVNAVVAVFGISVVFGVVSVSVVIFVVDIFLLVADVGTSAFVSIVVIVIVVFFIIFVVEAVISVATRTKRIKGEEKNLFNNCTILINIIIKFVSLNGDCSMLVLSLSLLYLLALIIQEGGETLVSFWL